MKEIIIRKNDASQRLDRFIMKAVPALSTGLCQKYIRKKRIKVNGRSAQRDYRLMEGDVLSLYLNDELFEPTSETEAYLKIKQPKLQIVYEDENILLLDKQPGLLCHAAEGESVNTLIANIQAYLYLKGEWNPAAEASFAPALCNRIDRNTGGIVIAAKNAEALRIINEKIKAREIDKYYLCVTQGVPSPETGTLKSYIFKDAVKNRVYVRENSEKGAKYAETQYRVLGKKNGLALVECRLLTGRTHQIRAQLAAAGYPLLGDGKYGKAESLEKHQALYSYKLGFVFKSPAGSLSYLGGQSFEVNKVGFAEKYSMLTD